MDFLCFRLLWLHNKLD